MLQDKIQTILNECEVQLGKPYAATVRVKKTHIKDIRVLLERKYGWVVSYECIQAHMP
jgi:hypothetical protein